MPLHIRHIKYLLSLLLIIGLALLSIFSGIGLSWLWVLLPLGFFVLVGIWDITQTEHSILRNYPLFGHLRSILETFRPQIRQYFVESDTDGAPFSREQRSLVYQRAKQVEDKAPFGTELRVRNAGFEWLNHSIVPAKMTTEAPRIMIGGPACTQPYSSSVLNISAMSFGALSANAIKALNKGAKLGQFAHDTGEGGLSEHHRFAHGDLIWEIGSGYFSCRDANGAFDEEKYAQLATSPSVKMIQVKLSQGAKPGHGGVLPGAKVTAEIAKIRGVPAGIDCISPSSHSAFQTPVGLLQFIDKLRQLSAGKPVGFKLCIGHPVEFIGICKAMVETGLAPDFIVVDGKEGGTGAAPLEFSDHVGTPLREGLLMVHNALTAIGLRDQIRIGASGKIVSGFDMAIAMGLGADWCNSARGFMFALGCLQSQRCHTGLCPVGVATQDPSRQRALVVEVKAERVMQFHRATVHALSELVAAAGLTHPELLRAKYFFQRVSTDEVRALDRVYTFSRAGELLGQTPTGQFLDVWQQASADSFRGVN